jgi:hypothetical protein
MTMWKWLERFYEWVYGTTDILYIPTVGPQNATRAPLLPKPVSMPTNQEKLYIISKGNLGLHCTLNDAIPHEKGCAEALSYNLKQAGVLIPDGGIAGTASMLTFLKTSPQFQEVNVPQAGDIIMSATGTGNGTIEGHTGIVMNNGICSNDSASGLWLERWTLQRWQAYYQQAGGIPTRFFRYN